ncbi:MAG TPA: hypothetical protein VF507_05660 [Pyrinomonadaceae bacterium]|jgi:predicted metalloprotease with PDZ domain
MVFRTTPRPPTYIAGLDARFVDRRRASVARTFLLLVPIVSLLLAQGVARAQSLEARISLTSLSPARVKVEGRRTTATKVWSFLNSYAGAAGLGERIENLKLADSGGADVDVRKLAPGEYEAASPATRFSYEVKLTPPTMSGDAAHISWLTNERGLLMPGDLLPVVRELGAEETATKISFSLPPAWSVASDEPRGADRLFNVSDARLAVFYAGQGLREKSVRVGAMTLSFVTSGEWAFTDEEAAKLAADVLKDYSELFGAVPRPRATLVLSPFPSSSGADSWSAETRGGTVALLSGRSPSRTAALSQLSVPLTHELFHLWVPNGLKLEGDYGWFYEGFTSYQAMRASVRLQFLTFQDYLNAAGRAFDAYASAPDRDRLSLLEASRRRWTGQPALIYQKGMLLAFLYDLQLRMRTGGRRSLDNVYRELYRDHHGSQRPEDGNGAVIAALGRQEGMRELTRRLVESAGPLDLAAAVAPFGLRAERAGPRTRIFVADSLSRPQRDLLRKLGYNTGA